MADAGKTNEQLLAELAAARIEQARLGTLVDTLRDAAARQSERHDDERTQLEGEAATSRDDLSQARQDAAAERRRSAALVEQFKLEVDEQLKQLTREKVRNERIIESLPVGIAYLDRHLTCRWANPAFTEMVALPLQRLVGHTLGEAFPGAGERVSAVLHDVIAAGAPRMPVKLPFRLASPGREQDALWDLLAVPLTGEGDEVEGILIAVEVSEYVTQNQALKDQVAQLTRLERLKGEFIGMVSHELRTPLSAIAGYAEFLEDDLSGQLTAAQREYVTGIQAAEARIRGIVDDLLDFARLEAGTFKLQTERIDLAEVVKRELVMLIPQGLAADIASGLEVDTRTPLLVAADPKRVGQVLLNLVGNAIKFTPPGGSVTVALDADANDAYVRVKDTGIGIAPEHVPFVFDKFFQVDASDRRERGGAGLGLAISKMLIERQGGRMGVESTLGEGSTFWFTLPLWRSTPPTRA